jgi:hypothetical protein
LFATCEANAIACVGPHTWRYEPDWRPAVERRQEHMDDLQITASAVVTALDRA